MFAASKNASGAKLRLAKRGGSSRPTWRIASSHRVGPAQKVRVALANPDGIPPDHQCYARVLLRSRSRHSVKGQSAPRSARQKSQREAFMTFGSAHRE